MELQEALETRRSVRQYCGGEISDESLKEMIRAAEYAPSWKNSQVTRYYVVRNEENLKKVKDTLPEFNRKNCEKAPVLIVSTIILNRSGFERDGNPSNELGNGWGCYDCGMSSMNLLLKARELGISTLVMGIRDEAAIRRIHPIPDAEAVIAVIAAGFSDAEPEMPKRKPVEEIATFC